MKKTISILTIICCWIGAYAQQTEIDNAIKYTKSVIDKLEKDSMNLDKDYQIKKESLSKARERLTNFPKGSRKNLNEKLEELDLMVLLENKDIRKELEQAANGSSNLAKAYVEIFKMQESLGEIYNKQSNDDYKKNLDFIRRYLFDGHKDAFEKIASAVSDYRFIVFELARVFKVIDGSKSHSGLYEKLDEDYELEYIKTIKFADDDIRKYIEGGPNTRAKLRADWKTACKEAFK